MRSTSRLTAPPWALAVVLSVVAWGAVPVAGLLLAPRSPIVAIVLALAGLAGCARVVPALVARQRERRAADGLDDPGLLALEGPLVAAAALAVALLAIVAS